MPGGWRIPTSTRLAVLVATAVIVIAIVAGYSGTNWAVFAGLVAIVVAAFVWRAVNGHRRQ